MKYHLCIIGCQYNEWDGARIKYFLDRLGFVETNEKDAELIIVLACSVRQTAIDRIFGLIKNYQSNLRAPNSLLPTILITGCVLDADKKKFAEKGVRFFDSGDFETLKKYLKIDNSIENKKTNSYKLKAESCAFVPIMVGCDNFCSYCAVPYTRGREKSRKYEDVIRDVKDLVGKGTKEIMLLGQNVNSFTLGKKYEVESRKRKKDFATLLEKINDIPGDFKISFMSNHPKDMSDDIIEAVAKLPKVKKEIHLPLQSGSDKILKLMNRPYTAKEYLKIIENCKLKIENLVITTDVIVGFPGESEEDFQKTVEVFKKVNFAQAYVNKYSPRTGTVAYKLGDPIPWREKQRRWRILNEIANSKHSSK